MMNTITVDLFQPAEFNGRWYPARVHSGGGTERIDYPCRNESWCAVVCDTLNTELAANYRVAIKQHLQHLLAA